MKKKYTCRIFGDSVAFLWTLAWMMGLLLQNCMQVHFYLHRSSKSWMQQRNHFRGKCKWFCCSCGPHCGRDNLNNFYNAGVIRWCGRLFTLRLPLYYLLNYHSLEVNSDHLATHWSFESTCGHFCYLQLMSLLSLETAVPFTYVKIARTHLAFWCSF